MARKSTPANGRIQLEDAIATLIQNQAAFVAQLSESERQRLDFERRHLEYQREAAERFARIEAQMAEIIRVLNEHSRILTEHGRLIESLTEAVREKIGFKGQLMSWSVFGNPAISYPQNREYGDSGSFFRADPYCGFSC